MKRMSEVFELPVTTVYGGKWSDVLPRDAELHASHAINHVDALAALDDAIGLLSCSASMRCVGEEKLLAVLNAHRGAK